MSKYLIKFSKEGYMKYTSHLDMLRFFKRSFKMVDVRVAYSQGFNPHPKMSFGQPLSLGYSSEGELLEIETKIDIMPKDIFERLQDIMPQGISILEVERLPEGGKTIASRTFAAAYTIEFQLPQEDKKDYKHITSDFLKQDKITTVKRQKKSKDLAEIDIKPMIRNLTTNIVNHKIIMETIVDQGSVSNLSPELIISAFSSFTGTDFDRSSIEVHRKKIFWK